KVFMLVLMSEANLRQGEFYRSDLEWAVRLHTSTSTVYRARRELLRLGWIVVVPGTNNDRGGGLATRYLQVRWSNPPAAGEGHWTQMPPVHVRNHTFHLRTRGCSGLCLSHLGETPLPSSI